MQPGRELGAFEVVRCVRHRLVIARDGSCALCRAEETSRARKKRVSRRLLTFALLAAAGSAWALRKALDESAGAARFESAPHVSGGGVEGRVAREARESAGAASHAQRSEESHHATSAEDQFLSTPPAAVTARGVGPEPPRADVDPGAPRIDDPNDFALPAR